MLNFVVIVLLKNVNNLKENKIIKNTQSDHNLPRLFLIDWTRCVQPFFYDAQSGPIMGFVLKVTGATAVHAPTDNEELARDSIDFTSVKSPVSSTDYRTFESLIFLIPIIEMQRRLNCHVRKVDL